MNVLDVVSDAGNRVFTLERRQWVSTSLEETFGFFERPHNLPLITPRRLGFRILTRAPIVTARGLTLDYRVRVLGVPLRWRSLIAEYKPPHGFRDIQVAGPYRLWDHRHSFRRDGTGTLIEDLVVYALPYGRLGVLAHALFVHRELEAIFEYRRARIDALLAAPVPA